MARPRRLARREPEDPLVTVCHPKGWVRTVRRSRLDTALSSNWELVEPENPPQVKSPKSTEPAKPGAKEK